MHASRVPVIFTSSFLSPVAPPPPLATLTSRGIMNILTGGIATGGRPIGPEWYNNGSVTGPPIISTPDALQVRKQISQGYLSQQRYVIDD